MRPALVIVTLLVLTACGGREVRDGAGRPIDPDAISVPEPRPEPRARYGNHSPYTVNGKTYRVRSSSRGYRERGRASWYGSKFHGRTTSSGEPFDMYKVSAAHKTLPLPSWVEVTNLDNGRKLVVRVNDRGPFKDGRIIDLSYAAAVKLDVLDAGTAPVEVVAIDFGDEAAAIAARPVSVPVELQAGAFGSREPADRLARQLADAGIDNVRVRRARVDRDRVWRVRIGPVWEAALAQRLVDRILDMGLEAPVFVYP
ncbi:MAG: septal ring lytic transglycosylase RlpA family protein [Wenzhouxiangellaceae bacterium]|nr:septal ring lytic transglycosylase RlpA family protein [Wenzhouxiangellaceae bacterium]MBS3822286.1 septal ring lytic transglycosylase RlpA family protein [Wenzhouxiangellaceae bacterium]